MNMSKPVALLAYQDADLEKQQIESTVKSTPNRVKLNKLAKFVKQQQATLTKLTEDLESYSASIAKMTQQHKAILDRLDLENSEFETLKGDDECTSEEMTEFRHDIEKLQREAGNLEKEIKQAFHNLDTSAEEYKKSWQQGVKAKKEYDQLKVVCQKEKDDAAIDMLAVDKKMEELEKRVNPTLMNRYKRVRQHHNIPVVEVRDGKCSGCNMSLPSLSIRRLVAEDMILECDNCGRLLYADNE
jgi:predicted  nucleic acid-binding Zn-ribbon protein